MTRTQKLYRQFRIRANDLRGSSRHATIRKARVIPMAGAAPSCSLRQSAGGVEEANEKSLSSLVRTAKSVASPNGFFREISIFKLGSNGIANGFEVRLARDLHFSLTLRCGLENSYRSQGP